MKIEIKRKETLEASEFLISDIGCAFQETAIAYKNKGYEETAKYYQEMANKIFKELDK